MISDFLRFLLTTPETTPLILPHRVSWRSHGPSLEQSRNNNKHICTSVDCEFLLLTAHDTPQFHPNRTPCACSTVYPFNMSLSTGPLPHKLLASGTSSVTDSVTRDTTQQSPPKVTSSMQDKSSCSHTCNHIPYKREYAVQ